METKTNESTPIFITKRNGEKEPIDLEKIHRVITWASKGLHNVSVSQVELAAKLQFSQGIQTSKIHETIIKAAADLISVENPDYQYLAARLNMFHLRKKAFGRYEPPKLYEHVKETVNAQVYDEHLLTDYSQEDYTQIDQFIDHNRDLNFSYSGIKQLESKYLAQNRVTGQIYESPQFLYVLIGMCLFAHYPKENRLSYVKKFYDAVSLFKISLPTPIMAGVRTRTRQFSSCVLIESDDTLDSINATASSIVKYVSMRAGIGVNAGNIRALNSPIRNGEAFHTGCIPFYRYFQTAVKSCSQGGVRGGAATLFYPLWHLDVASLLVLKNNKGTEETRIRHLDYGVQINGFLYQRLIEGKDISLFSPSDVPGLYEAFFANQEEFAKLYLKYESNPEIRQEVISSQEVFSILVTERASTGRIYIQNVDHCNTHSAFLPDVAPIRQSNLCLEITLPTKPLQNVNDKDGEIALCTLSAFNLGTLENLEELEGLSDIIVRALDSLLSYQSYPLEAARHSSENRRTLGVGVINYAYYLAKNFVRYSDGSANALTHRTFEAMQYYLLKASCNLAKEEGACPYFDQTTYSKGILPIDTYKKSVDNYCSESLVYDWEELRKEIKNNGLRNSTLSALMPSETSSQVSNATNGIEPPRGFISIKGSKDGTFKQVVPDIINLKDKYELLWNIPNNEGYLQLVGIMQKFVDQAISANTNYDPSKYLDEKVPVSVLLQDLLTSYKYGLKTLYYHNTRDGSNDSSQVGENLAASKDEEDCVSCYV